MYSPILNESELNRLKFMFEAVSQAFIQKFPDLYASIIDHFSEENVLLIPAVVKETKAPLVIIIADGVQSYYDMKSIQSALSSENPEDKRRLEARRAEVYEYCREDGLKLIPGDQGTLVWE